MSRRTLGSQVAPAGRKEGKEKVQKLEDRRQVLIRSTWLPGGSFSKEGEGAEVRRQETCVHEGYSAPRWLRQEGRKEG